SRSRSRSRSRFEPRGHGVGVSLPREPRLRSFSDRTRSTMQIGIAYDLRSDFALEPGAPVDRLEEYDSQETVDAIARALAAAGHEPRLLGGGRRFLESVLRSPPELVFNIAEGWGTRSREAHVPAVCEMLRIPFTHSDP